LKQFLVIDKKLGSDLLLIDEDIIKELVPVLEILSKTTLIVSQNSCPAIHLVIQLKRILISLLKREEKDSQVINDLKAMLTINVEKYLKIQFIHKLALIFIQSVKTFGFVFVMFATAKIVLTDLSINKLAKIMKHSLFFAMNGK
jgi:hypothetical protein